MFGGANNVGELFNDLAVFNGVDWIAEAPANAPPPPRVNHAAWSMDGRLFVHNGLGTGMTVLANDYWMYDPTTREWTLIESAGSTPTPRQRHVAVTQQTRLALVMGGRSQTGDILNDVWLVDGGYNFNPRDTLPSGLVPGAALRVANLTYLIGQGGQLYSYYLGDGSWTALAQLTNTAGYFCAATSQDGQGRDFLHVIGGYDASGSESDRVYDYSIANNTWTLREERMPFPLVDSACVALPASGGAATANGQALPGQHTAPQASGGTSILLFGGESNGVLTNQTLLFRPHGGTPPEPPQPIPTVSVWGLGLLGLLLAGLARARLR